MTELNYEFHVHMRYPGGMDSYPYKPLMGSRIFKGRVTEEDRRRLHADICKEAGVVPGYWYSYEEFEVRTVILERTSEKTL